METWSSKTNPVLMDVDGPSMSILNLPTEILSKIVQFLPVNDRLAFGLVCKPFSEAAAHPSLAKNVCHKIVKSNLDIFVVSKQRFRKVVLSRLDLENRAVKLLWKRICGDVVDVTMDRCELRGGTLRRMLRDAKNLKVLVLSGLDNETASKWRAGDFKGLTTNVQKLTWNRTYMNDALPAMLKAMPGIVEFSLEAWCTGYRRIEPLPANVKEFLLTRLPYMKSLELIALDLDVDEILTSGSTAPLPSMEIVRLDRIRPAPNVFLSRLSNVKALSLKDVTLDDHIMSIVFGCTNLESLELDGYRFKDAQLHNIQNLQSLKKLTLQNASFTNLSCLHLLKLKLVQLEELKLKQSGLAEISVSILLNASRNLRVLVFLNMNESITNVLVTVILKMVHLEELEIGHSTMREPLALSPQLPSKLKKLTLSYFSLMTNQGFLAFTRFPLVELKLMSCSAVTLEGCKQFILRCPTLERFQFSGFRYYSMFVELNVFAAQNLKRFRPVHKV